MKDKKVLSSLKERVDHVRCKSYKDLCRHLYINLIISKMPISLVSRGICAARFHVVLVVVSHLSQLPFSN